MTNQELKEELAQLAVRLGNVEGYFENFDTTLHNHMGDYAKRQEAIAEKVEKLGLVLAAMQGRYELAVTLIRWVIFPMLVILAGLVGIKLIWPG